MSYTDQLAALTQQLADLRAENERLQQLKEPMGDLSEDQQARAWSQVWKALAHNGIYSFVPKALPCRGGARAVEFIESVFAERADLRRQLSEATQQLGRAEGRAEGLELRLAEAERERDALRIHFTGKFHTVIGDVCSVYDMVVHLSESKQVPHWIQSWAMYVWPRLGAILTPASDSGEGKENG